MVCRGIKSRCGVWQAASRLGFAVGLIYGVVAIGEIVRAEDAATRKVYSQRMDPREHPDDERHAVRAPDWATFQNRTQMTSLRGFTIENGRIVHFAEDLEKYTKTHELGEVIWPVSSMLFTKNLGEVVDEIKRRNLYLFDIWGFVPGSGPNGGVIEQFKPPVEALKMFKEKLGPRWLGMDVGEQDGRYVAGYASQMCPNGANRLEQYLNFQRFFQRMTEDQGNRMTTLVSLNFGHYLLKEGVYTLIGAETAQALPNGQLYYSFIRGAGKQYGVLWFGNASVWNRWGYKTYDTPGPADPSAGPTKGTSLSLLKRLMYSHILYNSVAVGFESAWFDGEKLTPIGRIQQAAGRWIKTNGSPGTMLTPVAVMNDFFAGWTFPRHLYSDNVYHVWGNLPYEAGDYLTDGVLDLLYPGYQNSAYYHDESGFLTPTPYGDAADCVLSDAPGWLLQRYPLLVIAGELSGGAEIRDKLLAYVQGGGRLVITAGNIAKMPGGLAGVRVVGSGKRFAAKQQVAGGTAPIAEETAFDLLPLEVPADGRVLARCEQTPAVIELACGKGKVTVLASPFGVGVDTGAVKQVPNDFDKPLPKPFPLLKHISQELERAFRNQTLFEAGDGLQVVACKKAAGLYTVGILNNAYRPLPFSIVSHCGAIASTRELPIDVSERGAVGHLPPGIELSAIGANGPATIAGGDVRIFEVRLQQDATEEIPHVAPPRRPRGRILPLRKPSSIKEAILARPTFFEHYDGVLVDWRYLHDRRFETVAQEAGWIGRQKLRVVVDLSSGINLYPDLRLVNNIAEDYAASMAVIDDVLTKMKALDAHDLVLSTNRQPENSFTIEQTVASTDATIREICRKAEAMQTTVHLRIYPGKLAANLADALQILKRIGAKNLRLAPSTAQMITLGPITKELASEAKERIGLWMVGGPKFDVVGRLWSVHQPIAMEAKTQGLQTLLEVSPHAPMVFDAIYENQDEEYLDASLIERLTSSRQ